MQGPCVRVCVLHARTRIITETPRGPCTQGPGPFCLGACSGGEMQKPSLAVQLPRPALGAREEGLLGGEAVEGFEEEGGAES